MTVMTVMSVMTMMTASRMTGMTVTAQNLMTVAAGVTRGRGGVENKHSTDVEFPQV